METQVKTMMAEAEKLEKSGQLTAARIKYAESEALIEVKDVTDAIKRLDDEIRDQVKSTLSASHKLYDSHKFKEAAAALDQGMKLQAYQSLLSYNLALCYYQLGEHDKALEYVRRAKAGAVEPKQKQQLLQLQSFFTTGENGSSMGGSDKDRIARVNLLTESIGMESSLDDDGGEEPAFAEGDASVSDSSPSGAPPQVLRPRIWWPRRR